MSDTYTLYGSYASYYTAKVRAYLRKKGIPFVERLPSDPMFRNKVRPASGSHRIPQLMAPDGEVIQDSVEIVDYLESHFPEVPAFPATPMQRTFVHLMELLGSEGLLRLAWMHRWVFEENYEFVKMDFGRSFRPQGSDEELLHYGKLISDRMRSYGLPEATDELRGELDQKYIELLNLFEAHLTHHPYFLGGHPSAADYGVMGALHAHMGRDPAGLRVMQDHGQRTFRWMEHMLVPEIQSPEFYAEAVEYLADDQVPKTALAIAKFISENYGEQFVLGALAFNDEMEALGATSGYALSPDQDQPNLAKRTVNYRGEDQQHSANLYHEWVSQRARIFYQQQPEEVKTGIESLFGEGPMTDLLTVPVRYKIIREQNRLILA